MAARIFCLRWVAVAIPFWVFPLVQWDCAAVCAADPAAADTAEAEPLPAVGSVAPEIEGVDIDEAPFRLSDYRGQVVVLDFWGDW